MHNESNLSEGHQYVLGCKSIYSHSNVFQTNFILFYDLFMSDFKNYMYVTQGYNSLLMHGLGLWSCRKSLTNFIT